jgi:hypothetical protein
MANRKRGRPPKDGPRYPSGQLKPESAGITGTALQRLRALGSNPLLETQVGRLLFLEELRPIDAQTAFRIAEIYGRYDRALGRHRSAHSPSYEVGRGRDLGLLETESQRSRAESAARRFGALQAEIKLCPRGVKPALEELCVEDRPCPPGWLRAVKIALDMLAVPLGIRRMRRAEVRPKIEVSLSGKTEGKVSVPRAQLEREAFIDALMGQIEISPAGAAEAFDRFKALYERERFRLDKTKDKG